jgi:hypothetical protein
LGSIEQWRFPDVSTSAAVTFFRINESWGYWRGDPDIDLTAGGVYSPTGHIARCQIRIRASRQPALTLKMAIATYAEKSKIFIFVRNLTPIADTTQ